MILTKRMLTLLYPKDWVDVDKTNEFSIMKSTLFLVLFCFVFMTTFLWVALDELELVL